jgi:hypothetical protein
MPVGQQELQLAAKALALGLVLDALRDADVRVLRQVDEQPAGEADLRGQARALRPDRILDHLHEQRLALVQDLLDRARVGAAVAVLPVLPDVGDVQEGARSSPISTNALCIPGSTRATRPRQMLPTRPRALERSM